MLLPAMSHISKSEFCVDGRCWEAKWLVGGRGVRGFREASSVSRNFRLDRGIQVWIRKHLWM